MKFEEYMEWIEKHGKPEPDLFTIICSNCGESVLYEDMIETGGYGFVCCDCLLEEFVICDNCDAHIHRDDMSYISKSREEDICEECYKAPVIEYMGVRRY